ncbi:MAG TPA: DUF3455 domain-containing protein [Gemmatimonadaceae bacterium]|nr:DUF3455 domain-containing protein [Gemmatimonadaceae bacterium]
MFRTARHLRAYALVVTTSLLSIGCSSDGPTGVLGGKHTSQPLDPAAVLAVATASEGQRTPDLSACPDLAIDGKLAYHVYAKGVQIYRWSGSAWTLVGPDAQLSADAAGNSTVGIHYAGPTWESNSGSKVVGTVAKRCPQPNAIPWLLLDAASEGPGIFHRVTQIQRVNTVGGSAPAAPGAFVGAEERVAYSAEYFFYR